MTRDDKILDEIRALRPADDSAWAGSAEGRRVMARALAGTPSTGPQRRRPRRLVGVGVAATALTLVGGTAAAVVVFRPDSPTQAGCYASLSPDADTVEPPAALVEEVGASEACRREWQQIGEDVDTGNLVTCVNEHGGRGVFPAPPAAEAAAACGSMGWQPDPA